MFGSDHRGLLLSSLNNVCLLVGTTTVHENTFISYQNVLQWQTQLDWGMCFHGDTWSLTRECVCVCGVFSPKIDSVGCAWGGRGSRVCACLNTITLSCCRYWYWHRWGAQPINCCLSAIGPPLHSWSIITNYSTYSILTISWFQQSAPVRRKEVKTRYYSFPVWGLFFVDGHLLKSNLLRNYSRNY